MNNINQLDSEKILEMAFVNSLMEDAERNFSGLEGNYRKELMSEFLIDQFLPVVAIWSKDDFKKVYGVVNHLFFLLSIFGRSDLRLSPSKGEIKSLQKLLEQVQRDQSRPSLFHHDRTGLADSIKQELDFLTKASTREASLKKPARAYGTVYLFNLFEHLLKQSGSKFKIRVFNTAKIESESRSVEAKQFRRISSSMLIINCAEIMMLDTFVQRHIRYSREKVEQPKLVGLKLLWSAS